MFQSLTCCKNSDSKNDELFKVDSKSDMFWRSWFKIWRVVKNLFQNLIFLKNLDSKTGFFSIFSPNHGSWESAKPKKLAFSRGKRIENWFSASKSFIIICFNTNQFHFKNWCVVNFFSSKSDTFYIFLFEIVVFYKKCSKSDAFEILDSKHHALYKKRFKNRFFSKKFDPSSFIEWKLFFPQQLFQECTKQPTLTSLRCILTGYIVLWEPVFHKILIF